MNTTVGCNGLEEKDQLPGAVPCLQFQGMGVHGVSRLRVPDPTGGDPTATEDYIWWLGQNLYYTLAGQTFR